MVALWAVPEQQQYGMLMTGFDPLQLLASDPHDLLHSTDMVLNDARLAVKHLYLFTIKSGCALNNSHLLLYLSEGCESIAIT